MKNKLILFFSLMYSLTWAQNIKTIKVSTNDKVYFNFEEPLKYVDIGNESLVAKGQNSVVPNLIWVKAKKPFTRTSIKIITQSGQDYIYFLEYTKQVNVLNLYPQKGMSPVQVVSNNKNRKVQSSSMDAICNQIESKYKRGFIHTQNGKFDTKSRLALWLKGVYHTSDKTYFQVQIENKSRVPFQIGGNIVFEIEDGKKDKTRIEPISKCSFSRSITKKETMIYVFPKTTVSNDRNIIISVSEDTTSGKNTNRKVTATISASKILNGIYLN